MEKFKLKLHNLLRWSEKYTKTDMVYLAKGGAWSGIGTILSYAIALVGIVAFANLLPKETYGTYQYVLSIADLCGIFVLAGIDTAVTRSTARGQEGTLYEALGTKIRWGFLGGVFAVLVGIYYFSQENSILGSAFIVSAIAIPFWEAPGLYVTYLQGKKRFDLTNMYGVGAQFVATLAVVATIFLTDDVLILLTSYFLSWGIARFLIFFITVKKFPPNNIPDLELIPYGKHLTVMQAASNVSMIADKALLWHFLGAAPVAVYIFAQAIPLRGAEVIKIVNRLAFPKMAEQNLAVMKETLPRKVRILFVFGLLFALFYALIAPFLFSVFFPKYLEAVPFTQVATILIALQPFSLFSSALSAQARKKSLYAFSLGNPLIRIVLFSIFIPMWGLWGAVWALVFAKVAENVLLAWLFYRA